MYGESNEVVVSQSEPKKTFYYPYDAKKTGDVSHQYPPAYLLKETKRLNEYDFV